MFDLHTHTVHSDGTCTPAEVAALAAAAGLRGVALTDHDNLDGWADMAEACAALDLVFVPGVELSAELDGRSVHLLGYWVDPGDAALRAECERLRGERERRARLMVARLVERGVPVTWEEVAGIADGAPVGRPHLATALVRHGAAGDLDEAFRRWLAEDGAIHEPKRAMDPAAAVRLVVGAGGAVVLAHPGLTFRDVDTARDLVATLARNGLRGLEADHPAHDGESSAAWSRLADELDLVVTGASDFHGDRKAFRIGQRTTPSGVVDRLRDGVRGGMRW